MNRVHFSSKSIEWSTPQGFFDKLNEEFKFDLDVCASAENAKCEKFFSKEDNGLLQKWSGVCWMNPPYGREIHKWVKKARDESKNGAVVVCLVPSRTETAWWHDFVLPSAKTIRFVRGRIKFSGSKINAPFPSAVVVFDDRR